MPNVFVGWETWEKLVFILACAITITIAAGRIQLLHAHWKLRRHPNVTTQKEQKQVMNRTMSRGRVQSSVHHNDDISFGVRAIESGIEVDGVWIIRGNSPDTSRACSIRHHPPTKWSESDEEKQELPSVASKHPYTDASKTVRSRHPPVSYAKYGSHSYITPQTTSARTLRGLDAIYKASTSIHDDDPNSTNSSKRSSGSSGDIEPIFTSAPSLLMSPQAFPAPAFQSAGDLDLLDSHGVSQAAEMEQFTSRGRHLCHRRSVNETGYDRLERRSIASERQLPSQSPAMARLAALSPAVRRSSMPDVTPFTEFCKRVSHDSRPKTLGSHSNESTESAEKSTGSGSPRSAECAVSVPVVLASERAAEMKLAPPMRTSFENRATQIMRGHGTGFEILKPGSLNPTMSSRTQDPWQWPSTAPSVSLSNSCQTRSVSEDGSPKLQKKRRPTADSVPSSHRRRSRIGLFA